MGIDRNKFIVVYAGNLGYAQGIDVILEAAKILDSDDRISFIIFGNGAIENEVKKKISEMKMQRVNLYPLQPYERVSEVYSMGDACIVACKRGTGGFAMPSKTWSIMGCGRAVLASFDTKSSLQKIVEGNNCGLFAEAGDARQLADSILTLADSPEITKEMGKNARAYIEQNLSRKTCTGKICKIIYESKYN